MSRQTETLPSGESFALPQERKSGSKSLKANGKQAPAQAMQSGVHCMR